jgi:hypothetical protein
VHEIPAAGKRPFPARPLLGCATILLLIFGLFSYVRFMRGNDRPGPFGTYTHGHAPGPVKLRLEPFPPLAEGIAASRGHAVLYFNFSFEIAYHEALPQINRAQRAYASKGLEVIGIYNGPRTSELETRLSNAGVDWRVFHDAPGAPKSEWRKRFAAGVMPGVVLVGASGEHVFNGGFDWPLRAALEKLLGPPENVPTVIIPEIRGRLLHDGRPLPEFTSEFASFASFRDEALGQFVAADFRSWYDNKTGEFRIFNVPEGTYGVYISCGPFWHNFRVFAASGPVPCVAEFSLTRRIYLREPVDTSKDVAAAADCRHRSPVTFRWDAVPGAVEYVPYLYRVKLGLEEAKRDRVDVAPVKEACLVLPIEEGWEYQLGLSARSATSTLAWLHLYQDRGLGSDYRFREGPPRVEKEPGEVR